MLIKTEKLVHIKKNTRNFINVVREHYLRDDIPCKSHACYKNCVQPKGLPLLTDEQKTTHYVIPDITCCRKYLEILELKELTNIISLQSVVQQIKKKAGKRVSKNITGIHKNPLKSSIVFDNEFRQSCYVQRKEGQDLDEWFWK
ncbi:DIS3-like exonuclease 1 [Clytia hemisphaerica]|uniref:DIS3-like exonuclease 1 n=1 Tax=Clytia hemisphaerica TaxID=252671 RepID=UPI0034D7BB66